MASADLGDALRLGDDRGLGRRVAVEGAGFWAAHEDPRGVRRTDHDRDPPCGAHLELLEALLLEQRIRHGNQEEVERSALQKRGIMPLRLMPAPMAAISPAAFRSASAR
ncbi:MAG TPA: hypothetical protein VFP79_18850 [Pseudolabrys sp.]|nr:hypothetical protein [Pseudolabrys sp.]